MNSRKITSYLALTCLSFCSQLCWGEVGYTIRKVANSENVEFVSATNKNGWIVFTTKFNERNRMYLTGPHGYQRELTAILPLESEQDFFLPIKVTNNGSVILLHQRCAPSESCKDQEVVSIPFELDKTVQIADFSALPNTYRDFAITESLQVVSVEYSPTDPHSEISLKFYQVGKEIVQNITLPNTPIQKRKYSQNIKVLVDDNGNYLISRTLSSRREYKVADICSGSLTTSTIDCLSNKQLRTISRKIIYDVEAFHDGQLTVNTDTEFKIIDLATLSKVSGYRTTFRTAIAGPILSDDDTVITLVEGKGRYTLNSFSLYSWSPNDGQSKYFCRTTREFRSRNPFFWIAHPGSKDTFYVTINESTDEGSGFVLYEFIKGELNTGNPKGSGICKNTSRRSL